MKREELTQEIVREFLDYDPESGVLTWRERDLKWFDGNERICNSWNAKFSNKQILSVGAIHGYISLCILRVSYKAHRIIWLWMTGEWPEQVDHINHIRHDNRWENLRNVTNAENARNHSRKKNQKSSESGIRRNVDGTYSIDFSLGSFNSQEEAHNEKVKAEEFVFERFAKIVLR